MSQVPQPPIDVAPDAAAHATPATTAGITATVRDYYEGWFEADPERMRRALHPDLVKRSLADPHGAINTASAHDMVAATGAGSGTRHPPERRHFTISINHVHGPSSSAGAHPGAIADVHVTGDVYVDYLQLVLVGDRWQILNALWAPAIQTPVEARPE